MQAPSDEVREKINKGITLSKDEWDSDEGMKAYKELVKVSRASGKSAKLAFYEDYNSEPAGKSAPVIGSRPRAPHEKKQELDFYHFGGAISYDQIKKNIRVPGINKRLMVILPTEEGHKEYSLLGNEKRAVKDVKINQNIIKERIEVLSRRDKIGRTGVLLKKEVPPDMSVEQFFKYLTDRNPTLRRN